MGEDLRVVKTKRAIRAAFLNLRRHQPLEKVTVLDICRDALINKSTFYHHYRDVFELSDHLEDDVLDSCFATFEHRDRLLTDPLTFLREVPTAIDAHKDVIDVLFSQRQDVLYAKVKSHLRAFYLTPETTPTDDVLLTFIIGGALHAMQTLAIEGHHDKKMVTEESARIISKLAS